MGFFEKEERRKRKEAEEASKKMQEEAQQCLQEIQPILKKYNFELGARVELARNGILARPEFVRPQPQTEPAPKFREVKGPAKLEDLPRPVR